MKQVGRQILKRGEDECFLSTPRYYEYLGIAKRLNIELLGLGWVSIDGVLDPLLDTKPASYWTGWPLMQEVWPVLQRKRQELQAALKARKRKR